MWCEDRMTSKSRRSKLSTAFGKNGKRNRWREVAPGIRFNQDARTLDWIDCGPRDGEYSTAKIGASGKASANASTQRSAPPRWTSGSETIATRTALDNLAKLQERPRRGAFVTPAEHFCSQMGSVFGAGFF